MPLSGHPGGRERHGRCSMRHYLGKVRPQIFLALLLLGGIAFMAIHKDSTEIAVGCIAGVIALSKDVLQSDSGPTQDD